MSNLALNTKKEIMSFIGNSLVKVLDEETLNKMTVDIEKEKLFAYQALTANSYLLGIAKSNPASLVKAVTNIVLTGASLNPVLKLAYLVPRDKQVMLQFSYKGMINLLEREGAVKTIYADVVREGDEFIEEKGTDPKIFHKPVSFSDAEIIGAYAVAVLKDDSKQFVTLSKKKIELVRTFSKVKSGNSPWSKFYDEMAKKTAIHNLCKTLPLSDKAMSIFSIEEQQYKFKQEEQKKNTEIDFGEDETPKLTENQPYIEGEEIITKTPF